MILCVDIAGAKVTFLPEYQQEQKAQEGGAGCGSDLLETSFSFPCVYINRHLPAFLYSTKILQSHISLQYCILGGDKLNI